MNDASIRVAIADDQALLRGGFRVLIDSTDDLTVVGEAETGREAIEVVRRTTPDVVLMDIRMPDLDGLAATREIASDPALDGVRIVILTTYEVDEYILTALRAGACGFLGKGMRPAELPEAIRIAARGEALLSPKATRTLIARYLALPDGPPSTVSGVLADLTDREREIVALVAEGLSNEVIADYLIISRQTVRTHVHRAMAKLGARNRAQLVVFAYQTGLVRPSAADL
ncbi:response regulator transcription factor [Streptomyces sp. NPDC093252]|uniref:response regulator transcription factor n=1 Tax=Streptomyces sp. NPDC093252 TaxID=3154980 RepID=UPI0034402B9C